MNQHNINSLVYDKNFIPLSINEIRMSLRDSKLSKVAHYADVDVVTIYKITHRYQTNVRTFILRKLTLYILERNSYGVAPSPYGLPSHYQFKHPIAPPVPV